MAQKLLGALDGGAGKAAVAQAQAAQAQQKSLLDAERSKAAAIEDGQRKVRGGMGGMLSFIENTGLSRLFGGG